ncbi:MAG: hypothetical protein DLD55_00400 [candidate division SR1 bacterium]|nr:MAG: hypothetical protein DLD55_00400 [candidate division SR1 bacterium]
MCEKKAKYCQYMESFIPLQEKPGGICGFFSDGVGGFLVVDQDLSKKSARFSTADLSSERNSLSIRIIIPIFL